MAYVICQHWLDEEGKDIIEICPVCFCDDLQSVIYALKNRYCYMPNLFVYEVLNKAFSAHVVDGKLLLT